MRERAQRGSWSSWRRLSPPTRRRCADWLQGWWTSIKAVLSALTGQGYEDDAIGDGNTAAREYVRVVYGGASDVEKAKALSWLREYCKKDTWAMVEILSATAGGRVGTD